MKNLIKSFLLGFLIFALSSFYLFLRRGDYNIYIANKTVATAALFLLGLSLVLGSVFHLFNFADNKLVYRKWLGITGFIFAGIHIFITDFFLSGRFMEGIEITFGKLAFILFLIMFILSNKYFENKFGEIIWRKIFRYLGNAGFLFVAAHFSLLKYKEWLKWFKTFDPALPPLSLLGIIFVVFVFALQLAVFVYQKSRR